MIFDYLAVISLVKNIGKIPLLVASLEQLSKIDDCAMIIHEGYPHHFYQK
jgi:hypothetical protein